MIKSFLFALTALLAAGGMLRAEGEKLAVLKVGPETYTGVTVTAVTATDLYFSHSRGLGNAKLKNLDAEVQKQFHFDPAKAAEQERQQAAAQALYAQALKEAKPAPPPNPTATAGETEGAHGSTDEVEPHEISAKSFLNKPAPTLIAEQWLTPTPNVAGKFIMVDFWATWCGPCRRSIPKLNGFCDKFRERLVIIGLSDESEQEVRKMTNPKIDYSVAVDSQHRASSTFGVERIPYAVLVDPKGIVRFEGHPGYLDERKLETLLNRYAN